MPAPVTPEKEDETFAEQTAISATLERYIAGARTGDAGLMRLAFAANARISGTYGGKPVERTVEEFCSVVENGGPAEGLEAQIVAIEYSGNAGMARLEARNWRGTRYTDFFVLSKQGDSWGISSKVFYAHSRA
ncbi:MAG: nuclear transport factor 2 family protein [Alphaproteobacteria bacterium]|nr:nuclear transport factor 2 family protein [Alphaproteobacteria bacterium]MBV9584330.1 nuclear transport factor 2 family protein [Alphaproteobacteria bacterium]